MKLQTERLLLIPYTKQICIDILASNFSNLYHMGLTKGISWPDNDVLETLPKIINNLSLVEAPTGFESWMIIKNDTKEIIGEAGFKGYNSKGQNIDIGYGIIKEERGKGYAKEAATALIEWAFSNEKVTEITAECEFDNFNSIHLLQKLNFEEIKRQDSRIYWSSKRPQNIPRV